MQSGTACQKEQAAGVLANLANNNDENQVLIAQAGAIAPLVTLVQSGTDDQKEKDMSQESSTNAAYLAKHDLERKIANAVAAALKTRPANLLEFICAHLQSP